MKVCIVTVYNSENCGSFWQARALGAFWEARGHDVFFLERPMRHSSHSVLRLAKNEILCFKRFKLRGCLSLLKQYAIFSRASKRFTTVPECDASFDLCILGSDTIWNLKTKYFSTHRLVFWGGTSRAKRTIAYAASMGNSDEQDIQKYPELIPMIDQLNEVYVRDTDTQKALARVTDRSTELVCDPTLLVDRDFYLKDRKGSVEGDILFIYYFNKMPTDLSARTAAFAKEHNLKLVVMGDSMDGDIVYDHFDPYLFIECFSRAKFVVTNTFHGTIFSVIFEIQSVYQSCGKKKIRDMLREFGIEDQDYDGVEDPDALFRMDAIDFESVRIKVKRFSDRSKQYLLQQ